MIYLLAAARVFLLLRGGDLLVRGAVTLARRLGVSPLILGLTIVVYGTIGHGMAMAFLLAYGACVASKYFGFSALPLPQA